MQKKDKSSRILGGPINEYFTPLIVEARNTENAGVKENQQIMINKLNEIYKVSGRELAKKLQKNTEPIEMTLTLHGEKEEVNLSQNQLYKKYIEAKDPTLEDTFAKMGYTEETHQQIDRKSVV